MPGRAFGRIILGQRMRELRERAGVTREAALAAIEKEGHHPDTLRKAEEGTRLLRKLEVTTLARLYGCTEAEVAGVRKLWDQAREPSAFASFGLPEHVVAYLDLERAATEVRTFQNLIIPGMLQVEPYMRRLFQLAHVEPSVIDSWVQARLKRQERLRPSKDAPDPVQLIAVIGEEALLRCVREPEGPDQLAALVEFANLENVEIQIMDLDAKMHAGMAGSFTHLTFEDDVMGDFVYQETISRGQLTDLAATVRYLDTLFDELRSQALDPTKSLTLIAQLAKQGGQAA
ncbi:MAG: helix-turn-helix domain-containing protein [Pseudonocardiaceae bacterium]